MRLHCMAATFRLSEKRLPKIVRSAFAARADDVAEKLRTRNRHARSVSAQHAHPSARDSRGPAKKQAWPRASAAIATGSGQVEEMLRQMRGDAAKDKADAAGNGAHA